LGERRSVSLSHQLTPRYEIGNGIAAHRQIVTPISTPGQVTKVVASFTTSTVMIQVNDTTALGGYTNFVWGDNTLNKVMLSPFNATLQSTLKVPTQIFGPYATSTFAAVSYSNHGVYSISGNSCFGIFAEDVNTCTGHGSCIALDTCVCRTGYADVDCGLPICYGLNSSHPSVCSGHGMCGDVDACICYSGYTGTTCGNQIIGTLYSAGGADTGQAADGLSGVYNTYTWYMTQAMAFSGVNVTWSSISQEGDASLVLTTAGVLYGVGLNTYGLLGDGTATMRLAKTLVTGPILGKKIVDVCAGLKFAMAVDSTGKLYAWGYNGYDLFFIN
jgi:hypothetical protein